MVLARENNIAIWCWTHNQYIPNGKYCNNKMEAAHPMAKARGGSFGQAQARNERGFDAKQFPERRMHVTVACLPLLPNPASSMYLLCTPVLSSSNTYPLDCLDGFTRRLYVLRGRLHANNLNGFRLREPFFLTSRT
jgi:hypothetical protein